MLKSLKDLPFPDPFYSGAVGFIGRTLEELHADMHKLDLPTNAPKNVCKLHDAIRHGYIYSYYSYDLLILAANQTFPCLEMALKARIGGQFEGRVNKKGEPNPPMLKELLEAAKTQQLIKSDIKHLNTWRNDYAHGSETILSPPMFLQLFDWVTQIIRELFDADSHSKRNEAAKK